jgi:hypothetical protein
MGVRGMEKRREDRERTEPGRRAVATGPGAQRRAAAWSAQGKAWTLVRSSRRPGPAARGWDSAYSEAPAAMSPGRVTAVSLAGAPRSGLHCARGPAAAVPRDAAAPARALPSPPFPSLPFPSRRAAGAGSGRGGAGRRGPGPRPPEAPPAARWAGWAGRHRR